MVELTEVRDILDDGGKEKLTEEDLSAALQSLIHHQIVYESTPFAGSTYALVVAQQAFFRKYFGAMGLGLAVDPRSRMVALVAPDGMYGWKQNRLRKDETMVLLALRYAYEEGMGAGAVDAVGRIAITTNELHDQLIMLTGAEPPTEARLAEIMKEIQRRGGVRVGERDRAEHVVPLTILPGIRILVPDRYIDAVIDWAKRRRDGTCDADVITHLSEFLAGETEVVEPVPEDEPADGFEGDGVNADDDFGGDGGDAADRKER